MTFLFWLVDFDLVLGLGGRQPWKYWESDKRVHMLYFIYFFCVETIFGY